MIGFVEKGNLVNKQKIDEMNLKQLRFLNDLLDGKFKWLTEEEKKKKVSKLFGINFDKKGGNNG